MSELQDIFNSLNEKKEKEEMNEQNLSDEQRDKLEEVYRDFENQFNVNIIDKGSLEVLDIGSPGEPEIMEEFDIEGVNDILGLNVDIFGRVNYNVRDNYITCRLVVWIDDEAAGRDKEIKGEYRNGTWELEYRNL